MAMNALRLIITQTLTEHPRRRTRRNGLLRRLWRVLKGA
jgi:hypothetical protein